MASKQLGKLRQWAGEVISSREKTIVTDEFKDLERDIELRKDGLFRLHIASEDYHHALAKKRDSAAVDEGDKVMPIDALGIVMLTHGEEFGEESAYGSSLVKFGRAHCKIATLQEAFALTLQDTFLAAMQRYGDEIKAYEAQRKKLDSRRLSYDAVITKLENMRKNKKTKEKDLVEAEEELEVAKQRFEETSEDVRVRMHSIQDNEIHQLKDLSSFLDTELNFAEQYLEVLREVKDEWVDHIDIAKLERPRSTAPSHSFTRTADDARSTRSRKSSTARRSAPPSDADSTSGDSDAEMGQRSRKPSIARRKSDISTKSRKSEKVKDKEKEKEDKTHARTPSKPARKRADSAGPPPMEREDSNSKRKSIAGWMMSSVSLGRKSKDKDNFSSLGEDEGEALDDPKRPPSALSNKSGKSMKSSKSKRGEIASRSVAQKRVRALYDFSGSSDELAFKAGDEIVVVSEVLDEWWMGELDGRKGLFPANYTEALPSASARPALPQRPGSTRPPPINLNKDEREQSQSEDEHPFGDHMLVAQARTPVYVGGFNDADSVLSSAVETEDEDARGLVPKASNNPWAESFSSASRTPPTIPSRPGSEPGSTNSLGRKAPPPPPPRRQSTLHAASNSSFSSTSSAASLQEKRALMTRAHSSSSGSVSAGLTESPFDEPAGGACRDFNQNPFKPRGMCSNCFQMHG